MEDDEKFCELFTSKIENPSFKIPNSGLVAYLVKITLQFAP